MLGGAGNLLRRVQSEREHGAWESSQCSAACGTGHITKKRTVITAAAFGGKACGALLSNVECNTQPCAINCVQTPFSA
jgi:hypothetical protein